MPQTGIVCVQAKAVPQRVADGRPLMRTKIPWVMETARKTLYVILEVAFAQSPSSSRRTPALWSPRLHLPHAFLPHHLIKLLHKQLTETDDNTYTQPVG